MKTDPSPHRPQISGARLKANRANAALSTGPQSPGGKEHSRSNALKHGLSARTVWPGQDTGKDQAFFRRAWARLGPRNPMEEMCVANLLQAHLREDLAIEVEQTVFTRQPVSPTAQQARSFPFLHEPVALSTVDQLARHVTHLSRVAERAMLALLRVRSEQWGKPSPSAASAPPVGARGATEGGTPADALGSDEPQADSPTHGPSTLEACLADNRLILPEEDANTYQSLVRRMWTTFLPVNLLEELVASDFIQAQWRLERVMRMERALFERSAVSATGQLCTFGFGFVQDSQRNQALESLHHYESVLRKRMEKRMALWRHLREQGWADSIAPTTQLPAAPLPTEAPASGSSPTAVAPGQPACDRLPDSPPTPSLATPPLEPCESPPEPPPQTGSAAAPSQ
jgi:hypothetical protein